MIYRIKKDTPRPPACKEHGQRMTFGCESCAQRAVSWQCKCIGARTNQRRWMKGDGVCPDCDYSRDKWLSEVRVKKLTQRQVEAEADEKRRATP